MKNLEQELKTVWDAKSMADKIVAMLKLIEVSHAKTETKTKARKQLSVLTSRAAIDKFAANYVMSGEGMKVL